MQQAVYSTSWRKSITESREQLLALAILSEPGTLGVTPLLNEISTLTARVDLNSFVQILEQLARGGHVTVLHENQLVTDLSFVRDNIDFSYHEDMYIWSGPGAVPEVQIEDSGAELADRTQREFGWYGSWSWET